MPDMPPKPQPRPRALIACLALGLCACGMETPQERMRAFIDRAQSETERRDSAHLRGMLSEDFVGQGTLTRESVMNEIRSYLLTHREIYVLTHLSTLELNGARGAHAVVYAALTDQPTDTAEALRQAAADLIRVEFDIAADEEGDLRVIDANWQDSSVDEMLGAGWERADQ